MMSRRTSAIVAAVLAVCLLLVAGGSIFASGAPERTDEVPAGADAAGTDAADSTRGDAGPSGDDYSTGDQPLAVVVGLGCGLLLAAGAVVAVRRRGARDVVLDPDERC